jgi:hypothetical protein
MMLNYQSSLRKTGLRDDAIMNKLIDHGNSIADQENECNECMNPPTVTKHVDSNSNSFINTVTEQSPPIATPSQDGEDTNTKIEAKMELAFASREENVEKQDSSSLNRVRCSEL